MQVLETHMYFSVQGFCALSMFNEAMMQGDVEHFAIP